MTDFNGWTKYEVHVLDTLKEHGGRLERIENKLGWKVFLVPVFTFVLGCLLAWLSLPRPQEDDLVRAIKRIEADMQTLKDRPAETGRRR